MSTGTLNREMAPWQLLDWRFLLPSAGLGQVAVGEHVPCDLRAALAIAGHGVVELTGAAGPVDGVVLADSSRREISAAYAALRPGGGIYLQVRRGPRPPAPVVRPSRWSAWSAVLRHAGFEAVTPYWSIPDLDAQLLAVPLNSAPAARIGLQQRGSTWRGQVKMRALQLAWTLRAGPLTAREGFFVARRPGPPR